MVAESFPTGPDDNGGTSSSGRWYTELTRYHWFVLIVAALGWLFDTMDQQLFTLARTPAMKELLSQSPGVPAPPELVNSYGPLATAIFLIGWAFGGLIFGVLGDRIGRAKTMLLTILVYSICTGLSALSVSFWDFAFYRFITGLGVGGEFAVGVSLVAEVMPNRARPFALGLLQALSAVGNVSAAGIGIALGEFEKTGVLGHITIPVLNVNLSAWRLMFVVGTLPALLAIVIRRRLKEPERWQLMKQTGKSVKLGSYAELLGDPRWRRNALVGLVLATSGVIGVWGIGFFAVDLSQSVFRKSLVKEARQAGEADRDRDFLRLLLNSPAEIAAADEVKPTDLLGPEGSPHTAAVILEAMRAISKEPEKTDASQTRKSAAEGPAAANQEKPMPEAGPDGAGDQQAIGAGPTEAVPIGVGPAAVTTASILDWLDRQTKQTAKERSDREQYLSGAPKSGEILAHVKHINNRANSISGRVTTLAGYTSLAQNIGAFFGIYGFSLLTHRIGRRLAFMLSFIAAGVCTALVFWKFDDPSQIFWMIPLMGACLLAPFGGYAIYFPELFPTRLRSTGTSLCYNVGRIVAAVGPLGLGYLATGVYLHTDEPMRWAGMTMCGIFVLGLLALPFAPETKGQPLPE